MKLLPKVKRILFPMLITFFYVVFVYFFIRYAWKNGLLVSVYGPSPIDTGTKFLCDFISSMLIVILLLMITLIRKKPLSELGITLRSPMLIAVLSAAYLALFLLNGDFTVKGFYAAFFYLVVVAFSEEFVFRGFLFTAIDREFGFWIAAVISGLLFGAVHAFMPSIKYNYDTSRFIQEIISNLLGQGILGGAVFALLYKKSKTLFVPVLVHAILDYSGVLFKM